MLWTKATVLIDYGMDSDDFGCFYMSHTYGTSIARVSETARGQHPADPGLSPFFLWFDKNPWKSGPNFAAELTCVQVRAEK